MLQVYRIYKLLKKNISKILQFYLILLINVENSNTFDKYKTRIWMHNEKTNQ